MIALGSDHGGYELKEAIITHLKEKGMQYKDYGCYNEDSVDYPTYAALVGEAINSGECELGLLFCGTGIGISMAANKIKGVRAAACSDYFSAKYTRLHNNANVLCLGGRVVGPGLAIELVDIFLSEEFDTENPRHQKRIDMLTDLENKA